MTKNDTILQAIQRTVTGKKVKQLRQEGVIIASISIPGKDSILITLDKKEVQRLFDDGADTGLVYIQMSESKEKYPCLLQESQSDPITEEPIHLMFRQVSLKTKVTTEVPITVIGEPELFDGAMMIVIQDMINISALPTDLPDTIEVDVSQLKNPGDSITLADIKIDSKKITLEIAEDQSLEDVVIVQIQGQQAEAGSTEQSTGAAESTAAENSK